jgi:hypothetical protein
MPSYNSKVNFFSFQLPVHVPVKLDSWGPVATPSVLNCITVRIAWMCAIATLTMELHVSRKQASVFVHPDTQERNVSRNALPTTMDSDVKLSVIARMEPSATFNMVPVIVQQVIVVLVAG